MVPVDGTLYTRYIPIVDVTVTKKLVNLSRITKVVCELPFHSYSHSSSSPYPASTRGVTVLSSLKLPCCDHSFIKFNRFVSRAFYPFDFLQSTMASVAAVKSYRFDVLFLRGDKKAFVTFKGCMDTKISSVGKGTVDCQFN